MKTRYLMHTWRDFQAAVKLLLAGLCLSLGNGALAQEVDFNNCDAPSIPIVLPMGQPVAESIGAINAPGGNLAWAFDAAPSGYAGVVCSGSNPTTCDGVAITLPAPAPASQVTLSGSPTSSGGGFTVTLEASVGITPCTQQFTVSYVASNFEAVMVLDRSGSMNGSTNIGAPATSRWDALHRSVNGFADPHLVNAASGTSSSLGVTQFASSVIANNSFTSGMQTIDASLPTLIDNELTSQSPTGSTAMGAGVENALAKFVNPTNPRTVLLFTDGEQNVAPYVDLNGRFLNATASSGCAAAGPNCTEIPTDINFVTVGIGQPSGEYLETLVNLADEHSGYSIITSNSVDFDYSNGASLGSVQDAFTNAIAPVLSQNSPQLVAMGKGSLIASDVLTMPDFDINNTLGALVLQLSYGRNFEIPQLLQLLAGVRIEKDGVDITAYFKPSVVGHFTNAISLRTDFSGAQSAPPLPRIASAGNYVVSISKPHQIKDMGVKLAVFADDHLLDMRWQVPGKPRVTQTFAPQMTLSWMGEAIDNADVKAMILKPGDDLGDLLANYGDPIDPSNAPDAGTAGYQKYQQLIANDPAFLAKLLPSEQVLTLNHQGGGVYSNTYAPGDISGVYQVLYSVNFDGPQTGKGERITTQSVYVRFGELDQAASAIMSSVSGATTTINMKPISVVGKLIGPGQQQAFRFSGTSLTLASVTDHQDGRYTFVLNGDPGQNVQIDLLGETIYQGPLDEFGSAGGSTTPTNGGLLLWIVLLIILLLIVLWLIRKFMNSGNP